MKATPWVERPLIFFDAQTTGMRPPAGQLLEVAWAYASAQTTDPVIHSSVLHLPDGASVSSLIRNLTGLSDDELAKAEDRKTVIERFVLQMAACETKPILVIHYAQFEKPFLVEWFQSELQVEELPFEILCSHQIVKRLHPALPSRNLRAVAGFFGNRLKELKRAGPHVATTHSIWKSLAPELDRESLADFEAIQSWIKNAPKKKRAGGYEYRIERLQRLALPDSPGVYRMRAKDGEILYVGKATSLKSRVNSYFRGKKGRESRKLELMAQVWDLDVIKCNSPLEAALLETDEIKRWNPPYNVSLKESGRTLLFYSRDFASVSPVPSTAYPMGPFKQFGAIENLRMLVEWIRTDEPLPIFYEAFEETDLREAYLLFCARHSLDPQSLGSPRTLLALGANLKRRLKPDQKDTEDESGSDSGAELKTDAGTAPDELSADELADKFGRLIMRAADSYIRAKKMTRLLNAEVKWKPTSRRKTKSRTAEARASDAWQAIHLRNGRVFTNASDALACEKLSPPWAGLGNADYDRMSVLLSELLKNECCIR